MIDRLPSGQTHLDTVLGGGLPANAINLIAGLPGTGKTMLAQQYVFRNASPERPAVYFTTASEPLDKLVRYGQGLEFFDLAAIGKSVFYEDLGPVLHRSGLPAALDGIVTALRDRRPGFLVIDSFKALQTYATDPLEFRRFVIELTGRLSAMPTNTFWVGEYSVDELADAPEFAVADAIIALETRRSGDRTLRLLQVLKLRGSALLSGAHAYRLSSNGVAVFPRLADLGDLVPYGLSVERVSAGVPALDEMLGGGLWPGSATLVAGPSGSGKTLTGIQFLRAGAEAGERVIFASLQENPTQIERVFRGHGWTVDGIDVVYRSPVDVYIDEWVYELLSRAQELRATRILIDSLSDLRVASPDQTRFHEYVYSLTQRCSRLGITLQMTHEIHDLFDVGALIDSAVSHLADNLVLLRYVIADREVERAVIVLKTRASQHDPRIRRFRIEPGGMRLDDAPLPAAAGFAAAG